MTVKNSTFYITGHKVTFRSDHLPLNKFLKQKTLNNTVNNWATEIKSFKIKFVYNAGKDKILADTLSRIIHINPYIVLESQLKDYEFRRYGFDILPKAKGPSVGEKLASVNGVGICEINITYDNPENSKFSVQLPLYNKKFFCLQEKDMKIHQM